MESNCWMLDQLVGLPLLLLCSWAGLWIWIHHRRLSAWRHAADAALGPRSYAVVQGRVETIGPGPAVSVEIDQILKPYTDGDGDVTYLWHETARRTVAKPFHIVCSSGARVRVEPAGRLDFCDQLDGKVMDGDQKRTRTSTLAEGELVHVAGRLVLGDAGPGGPYRGGAPWVMHPPEKDKLLISTESLGSRVQRKRDRHGLAFGSLLTDLILTYLCFAGSNVSRLFGRPATCGDGQGVGLAVAFAFVMLLLYVIVVFAPDDRPWYEKSAPLIDRD